MLNKAKTMDEVKVCYTLCGCDQIPERNKVKEETYALAHSLRDIPDPYSGECMVVRSLEQGCLCGNKS